MIGSTPTITLPSHPYHISSMKSSRFSAYLDRNRNILSTGLNSIFHPVSWYLYITTIHITYTASRNRFVWEPKMVFILSIRFFSSLTSSFDDALLSCGERGVSIGTSSNLEMGLSLRWTTLNLRASKQPCARYISLSYSASFNKVISLVAWSNWCCNSWVSLETGSFSFNWITSRWMERSWSFNSEFYLVSLHDDNTIAIWSSNFDSRSCFSLRYFASCSRSWSFAFFSSAL